MKEHRGAAFRSETSIPGAAGAQFRRVLLRLRGPKFEPTFWIKLYIRQSTFFRPLLVYNKIKLIFYEILVQGGHAV